MEMNNVFLEIGGNQGNRLQNIQQTTSLIESRIGRIAGTSSIYESPPWGFAATQSFFNQVLLIETSLQVKAVLDISLLIEKEMGRIRGRDRYSSRTMDVDILFYNDEIIDTPELEIPHPRLHLRNFVLKPLAEIAADFVHPIFNKTIAELLKVCSDDLECVKI